MGVQDINTARTDVLYRRKLLDKVTKAFQEMLVLFDMISKGTPELIGQNGIEFVMNVDPAGPGVFTGEAAAFPDPNPLKDVKGLVKYATYQRTVSFTGHELKNMEKMSDGEVLEKYAGRVDRDIRTGKKEMNQMAYGDSTAEVGRVIAGSGLPATVTSPVYLAQTVSDGNTFGSYKFVVGSYYQFFTSAGVQRTDGSVTSSKCTAVVKSPTLSYVTFDNLPNSSGTPTLVAGDRIVPKGSYGKAPYGLDYFFTISGVRQNLSLDLYPNLRATILQASNANVSAIMLSKLKHALSYRVEGEVNANAKILSSPAQSLAYESNGHPLRRAAMSDRTYDGSYSRIEFEGNVWTIDPDCPRDAVYRWVEGDIERAELMPYGNWELNGILQHPAWAGTSSDGTHAFRVLMYFMWIGQFFCRQPNNLSALRGLFMSNFPIGLDS